MGLAGVAQFLAGLLIPVSFEMFKEKVRDGLWKASIAIVAIVALKELVYDPLVLHQSVLHDSADAIYYVLGGAAAVIVVLAHRKVKKHKAGKK